MRLFVVFALVFSASLQSFANIGPVDSSSCLMSAYEADATLQDIIIGTDDFNNSQMNYNARLGAEQYTCAREVLNSVLSNYGRYLVGMRKIQRLLNDENCKSAEFKKLKSETEAQLPSIVEYYTMWKNEVAPLEQKIEQTDKKRIKTCEVVDKAIVNI